MLPRIDVLEDVNFRKMLPKNTRHFKNKLIFGERLQERQGNSKFERAINTDMFRMLEKKKMKLSKDSELLSERKHLCERSASLVSQRTK